MERSLHRELKDRFGVAGGGRSEVVLGGFRIDAETSDGRLIEIQSSPLCQLKRKLEKLLPTREIVVVKPMILTRRVIRRETADGPDLSSRRSPKRGRLIDIFEDLVGLARLFPHPNLRIDLLAVDVVEIRVTRRRRPGYLVLDWILKDVFETTRLEQATDLWSLLPANLPDRFDSVELARRIGLSIPFARQVAYCLLHAGATEIVAKVGNRRVYARSERLLTGSAGRLGLSHHRVPSRVQ